MMATFFAFVSGAPYFMIDVLGRSAAEYGLYFILVSIGYMAGNFTAARVTRLRRSSLPPRCGWRRARPLSRSPPPPAFWRRR
jgi:hypothetical protein